MMMVMTVIMMNVGTQYFSPNELMKPLFNLFAGIPGGCQFRRDLFEGVCYFLLLIMLTLIANILCE